MTSNPTFSTQQAETLVRDLYAADAKASRLPSFYDQNFLLDTAAGRRVLKISNRADDREALDFQNQVMARVRKAMHSCTVARIYPLANGELMTEISDDSGHRLGVRLLSYVEGTVWSSLDHRSPELFRDLGRMVAQVSRALDGFEHPRMHRFSQWDLTNTLLLGQHIDELSSARRREIVSSILQRFSSFVTPRLEGLPRCVVHGDINNDNVLVAGDRVVGLIDFGDVVYTVTIFELAIAMAYAMLGSDQPMKAAEQIVAGYEEIRPLLASERAIVFDLARTRVAASATLAAHFSKSNPQNADYIRTNESAAWALLEQLENEPIFRPSL